MDLKTFVKESLVEIAKGVADAEESLSDTSAIVNPRSVYVNEKESIRVYGYLNVNEPGNKSNKKPVVQLIEFDVSVFAEEESDKGGGLRIGVMSVGIEAKGGTTEAKRSESRIAFQVPMALPTSERDSTRL